MNRRKLKITLITPEIATEMLKTYKAHNHLKRTKVDKYKALMLNGKWIEKKGMAIKFHNSILADGAHRLHAIKESGCSLKVPVYYG